MFRFAWGENLSARSSAAPEFHLHAHYRSQLPLDTVLSKVPAGTDVFVNENYAAQIEAILRSWSGALCGSTMSLDSIAESLGEGFSGTALSGAQLQTLRTGIIEVWKCSFPENRVSRDVFLRELRASLSGFSRILTAEFQITRIDAKLPQVQTRIRYEVIGTGKKFWREQRTGYWDVEWQRSSSNEFRVVGWTATEETRSRSASPVFADVTPTAFGGSVSYRDQLMHGSDYWRTVLDGACGIDVYGHNGIAAGDFDNDGFDDLYICQPAGLPNRLYRNSGNGTFEDVTESAGVGVLDNTSSALFVDINNDGLQDLIVVRTSGPLLFLNQGGGKFRQQADAFKFATPPQGAFTGAAAADYDRDGWLDIYFCLYSYYQGADQYRYPLPYYDANNGPPNFMMRNNRDGTFSDVTAESGLSKNNTRYSFCCAWNDYNGDGWPDLYVVNDFGRKNLYRNNGDGTFTDVAAEQGVEDVGAGMSGCWFDYNNDGREDLYVGNMWTAAGERISAQDNFKPQSTPAVRALYQKHAMGNSLLRNDGGKFSDVTGTAGAGMGRWAWSSDAWDFDHDGFPDLYIANGMVSGPVKEELNSFFWRQTVANSPDDATPQHAYEQGWNAINELIRSDATWSGYERNVFYVNNGDGSFSDASAAIGLDFVEDGRSFAMADFDHDGRLEVFLKNRNAPQLRVLKNVASGLAPSISFRLRGAKSNRDAIGAVITLLAGESRQIRTLQAGSGFLSQHSKEVFFGLGSLKGPITASIGWPSGLVQELHDVPANHTIWLEEGANPPRIEPFKTPIRSEHTGENASPAATEQLPDHVETWLLSPVAAPDFSLPDQNGKTRTLAALRGTPVLLMFWSSASPTCRTNLENLQRRYAAWSGRGIELLALNVDDSEATAKALARELRLSFPVLRASEDMAAIYNILYRYLFDRHRDLVLPTSFLIDEKGEIVKLYQGKINATNLESDFRRIPRTGSERLAKALPFPGVTDATEFPRNYLSCGSIFFQRGYYDEAAAWFQRGLENDPESAEALYGLGSVYLKQGNNAAAQDAFRRVTKLHASYPDTLANAWNNLGLLATREGKTDEAIPLFQQALELNPNHLVALENLGNAYRQQRRWNEAREVLQRAVAVGAEDPEANYGLGMVFAQLDDVQQASDYLQRALKLRPDYPEALNNMGVLYLRTNRPDDAVASFEQCIKVAPAFDQAYLNLARVYAIEDAPDKARAVLTELLKQHPGHPQAQALLEQLAR
jgi:tetratricopeptide (TPR) repeat protein